MGGGAFAPALLVDKGCLDCFVNTLTPTTLDRVHGYLAQVATLLARADEAAEANGDLNGDATLVLLPVSNCDVPHLFATGSVRPYDVGMKAPCPEGAVLPPGAAPYAQRLWIHATIGFQQKHVYLCKARPPSAAAHVAGELRCFACGAATVYSTVGRPGGLDPLDRGLCGCGETLRRFAMS